MAYRDQSLPQSQKTISKDAIEYRTYYFIDGNTYWIARRVTANGAGQDLAKVRRTYIKGNTNDNPQEMIMISGEVKLEYQFGTYFGHVEDNLRSGQGTLVLKIGERYTGEWKGAVVSGAMVSAEGRVLEGDFEVIKEKRFGILFRQLEQAVNKSSSQTTSRSRPKSVSAKSESDNARGQSTDRHTSESTPETKRVYDKNKLKNSEADRLLEGPVNYEGGYDNDGMFHGQGNLEADGEKYEGTFEHGDKHGFGKETYTNGGGTFEGYYWRGSRHGCGVFVWPDGTVSNREYKLGKLVSEIVPPPAQAQEVTTPRVQPSSTQKLLPGQKSGSSPILSKLRNQGK